MALFFEATFDFLKQQITHWKVWLLLSMISFLVFFGVGMLGAACCLAYGFIFVTFVTLSGVIKFGLFVLLCVFLVRILQAGCGYLNLVSANVLDAAHGRPFRMSENRINRLATLFMYPCYLLAIALASCFLIIPGIFVWVYCSLAHWIMLEEGLSIFGSMVRSYQLVVGHFWAMLLMLVALSFVQFIPLFWLITLCFPIVSLSMASVYVQLKKRHMIASEDKENRCCAKS